MERIAITILFSILVLTSGKLFAQNNYEIRKIAFRGNDSIPEEILLDAMVLHPINVFEKKFSRKEASLFNRELINTDLERLTRLYQREGFMDSKVELLETKINNKKEKVDLIFKITEGRPFLVDSISFRFYKNEQVPNAELIFQELKKELFLIQGSRFSDDDLTSDLFRIKNEFKNYGYAYIQADYQITLKQKVRKANIEYNLNAGPICYFGETTLEGNQHVKEKFIRKQLIYKEGDLYNTSLLDETRRKMYKLQLFSILSVQPQTTKEKTTPVPIKLYMDEAPRFTTKYGLGYGTEDKFRTFADITYKGLLGGPPRLNVQAKHSALTPYQINFSYIQPQLFNPKLSLTINPFISRFKEPGYDIRDIGINVKLSDQFTDDFSGYANYYSEKVKNYNSDPNALEPGETNIPYSKSGILFSTLFDNSLPKFTPQKGVNISVSYKLNGYLFGGDYSYSRIWTDIRNYQSLGKQVLASRLMVGGIHSGNIDKFIPVEDRFYAGGSNSVRGWRRSELGPMRRNRSPLGGSSVIQGAVELRIPLIWKLSLVSFLDFGNVWNEEFFYPLNDLAWASGGGLRFDTPIGPIRFDVGVPIWNEKRGAEFFISVGQAF